MELPVVQSNLGRQAHRRLPPWLKKRLGSGRVLHQLKGEFRRRGLHTVCEEASCPNIGECWGGGTATFMILGDICTRHCGFCDVTAGRPRPVDPEEPRQLAEMIAGLGLKHVVITCVARDDLADGGASQFIKCIQEIRRVTRDITIEILTTDFSLNDPAIDRLLAARPDVFNHNIETVRRLTPQVRHRATYDNTLAFLGYLKRRRPEQITKSGLMLGLGETREEVVQTLADLSRVGCDWVTIGQYLRPARRNLPVVQYLAPAVFEEYEEMAYQLGFRSVASGPFVRSSYHAEKMDVLKNSLFGTVQKCPAARQPEEPRRRRTGEVRRGAGDEGNEADGIFQQSQDGEE